MSPLVPSHKLTVPLECLQPGLQDSVRVYPLPGHQAALSSPAVPIPPSTLNLLGLEQDLIGSASLPL